LIVEEEKTMSDKHTDNNGGRFLSDCVDFWFDGPGDNTVRPIPAEQLEQAKALRDRIRAAEAEGRLPFDCIDVFIDEPGDTPVRLIPPAG
jgi:hypothetical protein